MGLGGIGQASGGRQHVLKILESNIRDHYSRDNTAVTARSLSEYSARPYLRRLCLQSRRSRSGSHGILWQAPCAAPLHCAMPRSILALFGILSMNEGDSPV